MITFEEALEITGNVTVTPVRETVDLVKAAGRVLAEDIFSDVEMPPFDKAAVDGFACRREDLPGPLEVVEIIPAGIVPESVIGKGHCSRIMTGAMVPQGADTVVMVEHTETMGDGSVIFTASGTSSNIAYRAEDVKLGAKVLAKSTLLKPQHTAILAAVGITNVPVFRKPVAGIISTGDELTEPGNKPRPGQIRNSNSWQLIAQAENAGMDWFYAGIAADTPQSLRAMISETLEKCDILLLTGGVSMGDFDHVPAVIKELGIEILFKSIAVQPGRPTVFGTGRGKYLFGLPGNPVSAFVQFEMLVRPLACRMMGHTYNPRVIALPAATDFIRKKAVRKSFIPVKINSGNSIEPLEYHGSAHIHSYAGADGIVAIEIGETKIPEGALKNVRLL